ncbi:MAG: glycerate kinase [Microcoleaceae cyanobacterium]
MLDILQDWASGSEPKPHQLEHLTNLALADSSRMKAFDLDPAHASTYIHQQSNLFCSVCRADIQLPQLPGWERLLWQLWLPLTTQLIDLYRLLGRPLIQGILGGQGTGKTTLSQALSSLLSFQGYRAVSLSIDDLYKSYKEREYLRQIDPRLVWRGPPGTHDIETGLQVLQQLKQAQSGDLIAIPRFDKSLWQGAGDRVEPEIVSPGDIVLFEGWFVGCRPIDSIKFEAAPAPIVTEADQRFAYDMNSALQAYLPLWEMLDQLIVLNPVDYRLSKQWRKQAEQEMIRQGKLGMTDLEIEQFVDYFWKALHPELFILPLTQNTQITNLVIEINADHSISKIYRPNLNQ